MTEQLMNTTVRTALWQQLGATIDMLDQTLLACPGEQWNALLWQDQQAPDYPSFWSIIHHTLFWLDVHLTGTVEGFAPPAPFTLAEFDPAGALPERPYTKQELHGYLLHLRQRGQSSIEALTQERAQHPVNFPWTRGKPVSYYELLLYTMRHVQEHAAQLSLFLGQHAIPHEALDWVPRAKEQDAGEGNDE